MVRKSIAFPIQLAAILIFLVSSGFTFSPPVAALRIDRIAQELNLDLERDALSGRLFLRGEGVEVVICPGMQTALLNGKPILLPEAVKEDYGQVAVPAVLKQHIAALQKIERPKPIAGVPFKIVIDPGHGGMHTGGKGSTGLMEKDVVLDVSLQLEKLLIARGFEVVMTRRTDMHFSEDVTTDLDARVAISNREMPDLFVSVHSNYHPTSDPRGFEVFVARPETAAMQNSKSKTFSGLNIPFGKTLAEKMDSPAKKKQWCEKYVKKAESESRAFAKMVERSFAKNLNTLNRGVKEAGFRVIKYTIAPSVLVELEFISNPTGQKELSDPKHRKKLARLMADVITSYRDRRETMRIR